MQLAQRRIHRMMWLILGLAVPILFALALSMRPGVPIEAEAVERLGPPSATREGGP